MEKMSPSGQVKLTAKGDERFKMIPPMSSASTRTMSRLEKPRKDQAEITQQEKILITVCVLFQPAARHPAGAGTGKRSHGQRPPKARGEPGPSLRGSAGAALLPCPAETAGTGSPVPLPPAFGGVRQSHKPCREPDGRHVAASLRKRKQGAGDWKAKKQRTHVF